MTLSCVGRYGVLALSMTVLMAGSSLAFANKKMDPEIHTVVIEKLELAVKNAREDETVALHPVRARLADLYAERARLRSMEEAEQGCLDCKGARADRKRAIALYAQVYRDTSKERKGQVLLQKAHIHELLNEKRTAETIYSQVVSESTRVHPRKIVSQALTARGELRFSRADFRNAQKDFESASRLAEPTKRGYLQYRIAWCQLNKGEQEKAVGTLTRVLKTPELLTRDSTNGPVFDESFQEDVARDLATFIARGHVSMKEIRRVESLTPPRAQKDVMKHLASECERLGNRRAALDGWVVFVEHESRSLDRLEAMVRIAQLRFDLGDKPAALQGLKDAASSWKKDGCREESECKNLQLRLRKLVMDWGRSEKRKPTAGLLEAYQTFISLFEDDVEMTFWAANVARDIKKHSEAVTLYRKASVLASKQKSKAMNEIMESSLVGEVEMAELLKNPEMRQSAYDHYLALNPKGAISHKVRYQRAHLPYEMKNSAEASRRFHEFATSQECAKAAKAKKSEDRQLCVKAADLDLDSIALLKDDEKLEARALSYAPNYPERGIEYYRMARVSALKQADKAAPSAALKKLAGVNLTGADQEEKVRILKTRLSLAQKSNNLTETKKASQDLLSLKKLTDEDREFALSRLAWAHEMGFDFSEAYSVTKKMKLPALKADEKAMRLALLAELAGKNPRHHEEEFLRLSKNASKRAVVRVKLVRSAKNPARELRKHEDEISRYPHLYAPLALEIYGRTQDRRFAEKVLKDRRVKNEAAGQALSRILSLQDFAKLDGQIAKHKIRTQSDYLIQKTLEQRIELLAQTESVASKAIQDGHWTLQIIALATLSRENKRLHAEVLALPVPKKLKEKERETYIALVKEKAQPFRDKHVQIEKKLNTFWSDSKIFDALCSDFEKSNKDTQKALVSEMKKIASVAPWLVSRKVNRAISKGSDSPSTREVTSARRAAREQPFSSVYLKRLKKVESERGEDTMVVYLDARISQLEKGVTR